MAGAERVDHERGPRKLAEPVFEGQDPSGGGQVEREFLGAGDRPVTDGEARAAPVEHVCDGPGRAPCPEQEDFAAFNRDVAIFERQRKARRVSIVRVPARIAACERIGGADAARCITGAGSELQNVFLVRQCDIQPEGVVRQQRVQRRRQFVCLHFERRIDGIQLVLAQPVIVDVGRHRVRDGVADHSQQAGHWGSTFRTRR
jgi:hypothetical protein